MSELSKIYIGRNELVGDQELTVCGIVSLEEAWNNRIQIWEYLRYTARFNLAIFWTGNREEKQFWVMSKGEIMR